MFANQQLGQSYQIVTAFLSNLAMAVVLVLTFCSEYGAHVCHLFWKLPLLEFVAAVQSLRHAQLFAAPGTAARQASLLPVLHHLLELAHTHVHLVGDAIHPLILCSPLLLLPSIFPSIRVFSDESALLIRWSRYWSFSFSFSPSNEYSGLNSFRMDWFDLLAVQGTLKSLLQHHSLKASILRLSAFLMT